MQNISVVFFGTQNFAASALAKILATDFLQVVAVITQPDRATGREQKVIFSPVKELALKNNILVLQPENLKNNEINIPAADLYIVCQYGLIIPKKIIDTPKYGSINIHASLLPKYRGASPIQSVLINGETQTGVTIILMDDKMDHGPILSQEKIKVDASENAISLSARLASIGADLLIATIPKWINKEITAEPQQGEPTFCKLLKKEDGLVNFSQTNEQIYNLYRGLIVWPGIWTKWNNKRLKLLTIVKNDQTIPAGQVLAENGRIYIGCKQGAIEALELQIEGKPSTSADKFLNGYQKFNGARLL